MADEQKTPNWYSLPFTSYNSYDHHHHPPLHQFPNNVPQPYSSNNDLNYLAAIPEPGQPNLLMTVGDPTSFPSLSQPLTASPSVRYFSDQDPYVPNIQRFAGPAPKDVGHYRKTQSLIISEASSIKDSGYGTAQRPASVVSDDPAHTNSHQAHLPIQDSLNAVTLRQSRRKTRSQPDASRSKRTCPPSSSNILKTSKDGTHTCQQCGDILRLASDLKKHELRHLKPYTCDMPGCDRGVEGKGFTTSNDLERHRRSKHNLFAADAKIYKCAATSCQNKSKQWPRLDNFRQHVDRMHKNEDKEELVHKSEHTASFVNRGGARSDSGVSSSQAPDIGHLYDSAGNEPSTQLDDAAGRWPISNEFRSPDGLLSPSLHHDLSGGKLYNNSNNDDHDGDNENDNDDDDDDNGSANNSYNPVNEHSVSEFPGTSGTNRQSESVVSEPTGRRSFMTNQGARSYTSHKRMSEVVLHQPEQPKFTMVDQIAEIYGRESDEDMKRKIHELILAQGLGLIDDSSIVERSAFKKTSPYHPAQSIRSLPNEHASIEDEAELTASTTLKTNHSSPTTTNSEKKYECKYSCDEPGCERRLQSVASLQKHKQRHNRIFGCTFDSCNKLFGSKNDWKRHENSQHFQVDTWVCDVKQGPLDNECGKLCFRKEVFTTHLKGKHSITEKNEIDTLCRKRRIGVNGQHQFWCGFCGNFEKLRGRGLKAWDERFDHIGKHFASEKRKIDEWKCAGSRKTKAQVRADMRHHFKQPSERYITGQPSDSSRTVTAQYKQARTSARTDQEIFTESYAGSQSSGSPSIDDSVDMLDPILLRNSNLDSNFNVAHATGGQSAPTAAAQKDQYQSVASDCISSSGVTIRCCQCTDGLRAAWNNRMAWDDTCTCAHRFCDNCEIDGE